MRLAAELDWLDADEQLDTAVRARTVARICVVALAAFRQAATGDQGERVDEGGRLDFARLSGRELATFAAAVGEGALHAGGSMNAAHTPDVSARLGRAAAPARLHGAGFPVALSLWRVGFGWMVAAALRGRRFAFGHRGGSEHPLLPGAN